MTDRKTLIQQADELKWFHAMDFGDCQTRGRYVSTMPQNRSLFGVMDLLNHVDLTGLHCLDVGTADGLVAFNMASRGAARVVATDIPPEGRPTFHVARELLNVDVELLPGTSFDNMIEKLGEHRFDVVVCAGVMYHMLNPFDCVLKARRLLKRNGLLVFQTRFHREDEAPTLDFNPTSGRLDQINVFFVPSKSAITGMLALGGFQLQAIRSCVKNEFIAMIAQNVQPEEVTGAPALIMKQHAAGLNYSEFQRVLPEAASSAVYTGPHDDQMLNDREYKPDFFPHATEVVNPIGIARPDK